MTEHSDIHGEPTEGDRELEDQLHAARLAPAAGFRGALGRHIVARDPGYGSRPRHVRLIAAAYLAACCFGLGLGALQAAGAL